MKRLLLASFALAAVACASPRRTIYVEPSLLELDAGRAISAWNHALAPRCPEVQLILVHTREGADIVINAGNPPSAPCPGVEGGCVAAEKDGEIVVSMRKIDAVPDVAASILAHEIGHALGREGHSKNHGDLMFAPVSMYRFDPTPTATDVRDVCAAWGY